MRVVPEALAGELAEADGEQVPEGGGVEPAGEAGLRAGSEAAVEDGGEQVDADAGAAEPRLGAWRSMCATICRRQAREYRAAQAPKSRTTASMGSAGAGVARSLARILSAFLR